jgi:hypothetical protein
LAWQFEQDDWTKAGCRFAPHAATYLHQKRWLDEPPRTNGGLPDRTHETDPLTRIRAEADAIMARHAVKP